MSSEKMIERRRDGYVASAWGIRPQVLARHSYDPDEESGTQSTGYQWRIVWEDTAPPGVRVNSSPGPQWSDTPPYDWQQN